MGVLRFEPTSSRRHVPRNLLLQWHLTERCNLRCTHCYQELYGGWELSHSELLGVLEQYRALLARFRASVDRPVKGHVTVTGGEPFIRRDFMDLLDELARHRDELSFAILSNGTLIDGEVARRLRKLGPTFVQVSIDGSRETHDEIRGEGNFDKAVAAIRHLRRNRIRTLISFSAHRGNYREFPVVAELGRALGVDRVWSDRVIPTGSGAGQEMLTPSETAELFSIMHEERRAMKRRWFCRTEVAMHRALQFLVEPDRPYQCTAGDSLVTVQPNGDLYPCRRMPVKVGNLTQTRLVDLYYEAGLFRELRNHSRVSEGCQGCSFTKSCRGGLKCLSLAVTGDPFKADPGCWVAKPATAESHPAQA